MKRRRATSLGERTLSLVFGVFSAVIQGARGLRTLGVAVCDAILGESGDTVAGPLRLVGLISMLDPPRTDTAETVAKAMALGVDVKMLTGTPAPYNIVGFPTGRHAPPDGPRVAFGEKPNGATTAGPRLSLRPTYGVRTILGVQGETRHGRWL